MITNCNLLERLAGITDTPAIRELRIYIGDPSWIFDVYPDALSNDNRIGAVKC